MPQADHRGDQPGGGQPVAEFTGAPAALDHVVEPFHNGQMTVDLVALARGGLGDGRMEQHTVTTDIYTFGRLSPDGRLLRVDQLTRDPSSAG